MDHPNPAFSAVVDRALARLRASFPELPDDAVAQSRIRALAVVSDFAIDLFCTPQNGWRQGAQGQHQKLERCAGQPQDAAFRQQLQAGLEMAKLLEQRSSNAGMLQKLNRQMRSSRNPAERRSLQEQMDALDKVQAQLRRQMSALEANAPR